MSKLYILGNGGYAQEIFEQIILRNTKTIFGGFIILKDDKAFVINDEGIEPFTYESTASFILGTGNNKWRSIFLLHFFKYYKADINHFPNVSATNSYISLTAQLGIGNVFNCNSVVTANAKIGNFNCFNLFTSVAHDVVVGDYNNMSPYATLLGHSSLGNYNFLASKVCITPKVSIGSYNTISAGECVFDDMTDREFFQSGIITKKPVK